MVALLVQSQARHTGRRRPGRRVVVGRTLSDGCDADEEARAAKQAWQEALGKAEESMEEAKKGRTEGKGEKDGAVEV